MKKSTLANFPFLKPSTRNNPQLHTAVLMNPVEVDAASENHPTEVHHKLHGRWMLVGAVNKEMYLAFKANAGNDVATQLNVLPTLAGAAYGIVTSQIGAYQHRFVLPLYNSEVVEFLASTANFLNVYLESTGELGEGMLYDCSLAPDQIALARTMSKTIDCYQLEQFTKELPSVITEMLSLDLMPSLNAEIVLAVDVSVLLPPPRN
jgi:hypothetical protein